MSKNVRRLLALVFSLALLAGLALPAAAEGTISAAGSREQVSDEAGGTISSAGGSITSANGAASSSAPNYREIYVACWGDDMADGSRDYPLATLAAAADLANVVEQATVYVILLTDLTSSRVARFVGKNVILMSDGPACAIMRGSTFLTACDGLRGVYNPALIEVGELLPAAPVNTTLTIENVALDDGGLHAGSVFMPQTVDPSELLQNMERVQDAVIAVYNSSELILNPGTQIRNFGGMSAVRGYGAATITFEDYSSVLDTAFIPSPEGVKSILAEGALVLVGEKAEIGERWTFPTAADEPADDDAEGGEIEGADGEDGGEVAGFEGENGIEDNNIEGSGSEGENNLEGNDAESENTVEDNDSTEGENKVEDNDAAEGSDNAEGENDTEGENNTEGGDEVESAGSAEGVSDSESAGGTEGAGDGEDEGGEGGSTFEALLARLLELINNGTDDFSMETLEELLANVPTEELQELIDALNAQNNSEAADLISELAGIIGGDNSLGDELIRRLNALLGGDSGSGDGDGNGNGSGTGDGDDNGGDNGGGSGNTASLIDIFDLLGGSISFGDLSDLLSGFSPEQLGSLANIISGKGTDADLSTLFSNMAGVTGIMALSGDPEKLVHGEDPYLLDYTLTVNLPDTLVKTVTVAASSVSSGVGQFTVIPDSRLELVYDSGEPETIFTSNIFKVDTIEVVSGNNLVVTFSLKDGWRDYLSDLKAPIIFEWATELPEDQFEDNGELVTRSQLDSLELQIGDNTVPGSLGEVGAEIRTKMLPAEGAMLTYDLNGGEGGPDPNPVFVNAQTGYPLETEKTPTHADIDGKPVIFLGWTREKDATIYSRADSEPDLQTTITVVTGEDQTVYAVYSYDENEDDVPDVEQDLVKLSFDANGGEGEPEPIWAVAVAGVGASIDIPEKEPTLKFYTFLGWSKDPDATKADYKHDAQKIAERDILITKDTMLFAVWQENPTYTLYYNANGGSGAPSAQSGVSDENDTVEMIIASGVPTRAGYTFLGWSAHRSGSADYFAGDKVNITGGNVTLYAIWQKDGSSYSGGGGGGGGSGSPKTGDDAPIALYAALAVISLGAVAAGAWLILRKRK